LVLSASHGVLNWIPAFAGMAAMRFLTANSQTGVALHVTHPEEPAFLMEQPADMLELLNGIARGERAAEEKRTLTHEQAMERLRRWLE
jgi:hypothetical protein